MNKGAIIGIAVAVIVAGIVGIYAVTSDSNDAIKTPTVGIDDSAKAVVEEPVEPTEAINITVQERMGFSDP